MDCNDGTQESVDDKVFHTPSDLSQTDYDELLQQIRAEFTEEECQQELMDGCRYNDIDVVRGVLCVYPQLSSYQEEKTGNTAIHMAAANGHAEVVDLVLRLAPPVLVMTANASGNTPLHWAAANGQPKVVARLLVADGADVLLKNKAGRSSLTEGFASNKEEVARLLLQHESADEEKLVGSSNQTGETTVTHKFRFGSVSIVARELAIPDVENDSIIGQERPSQDTTGYAIWAASLVMSHWLASQDTSLFRNKIVLELGSGCGVPGLFVAKAAKEARVYLTDWNEKALSNLSHNIEANGLDQSASAHFMNWQEKGTWPVPQADILVGSDLVYQESMVDCLLETIRNLKPARIFYVAGTRRQGHDRFITKMQESYVLDETAAPASVLGNPFEDQDDESCFLHFNELSSMEFRLYDFRSSSTFHTIEPDTHIQQ